MSEKIYKLHPLLNIRILYKWVGIEGKNNYTIIMNGNPLDFKSYYYNLLN